MKKWFIVLFVISIMCVMVGCEKKVSVKAEEHILVIGATYHSEVDFVLNEVSKSYRGIIRLTGKSNGCSVWVPLDSLTQKEAVE